MITTDPKFISSCLLGKSQDINHIVMGFDGGGCKGKITSRFLAHLEAATVSPIYETADLLGGQSTGAIIAGCLACGVPARTIDYFYDQCDKFFQRNWMPPFPFKPMYKKEAIKDAIRQLIGDTRMGEVRTKLMIGAVDLCTDDNIYFKSWRPEHQDLKVVDAMERSFSAAIYFGSTPVKDDQKVYADGGTGNGNCPLLELVLEAYKLGFREEGMYVLSVGTGEAEGRQSFKTAAGYSPAIGQTAEFMNMARRQSVRTQVNYAAQIRQMNRKFDFCRADIEIPKKIDVLAGTGYVKQYGDVGDNLATTYVYNSDLPNLLRTIKANKKMFSKAEWLRREIYLKTQELNALTKGASVC